MHTSRVGFVSFAVVTLAAIFSPGCAAEAEPTPDESDLKSTKLGAYFIEGTAMSAKNNGVIWRLANRTEGAGGAVVTTRYFNGPDVLCDQYGGGGCPTITAKVAKTICDDLTSGTINAFAVFGYSRGVFIGNKAAIMVSKSCDAWVTGAYRYGGFLDGVQMSSYLATAYKVPALTKWHHIHRKNQSDAIYPGTNLEGGSGTNEVGPDKTHPQIGIDDAMVSKMATEANKRSGFKIFPGF